MKTTRGIVMTHDEIRVDSFNRIVEAINEVFPGIQSKSDNNTLIFDDEPIKVEMKGSDANDGYFDISNFDNNSFGTLWCVKPVVGVLVREIARIRRQKIMDKLR